MSAQRRIELNACSWAAVERLRGAMGCSEALAQVLVRRGLGEPAAARAWLAADEAHPPEAFEGMAEGVALVRRHLAAGSRVTVHGDYDVDGVCSTAVLVRALRALGGDVDWYLPGRLEDGYGLRAHTVQRLAARGTRLLITADCAITAVEEVALARAAGMDVLVTDHHAPRADGALPAAPIVHPAVCGYPCPELCAAGVAHKLATALGAPTAAEDLDLVALATVADVVPLRGENRRLVREGLRALATTRKPGLRALMRVARCDATRLDARAAAFRLAPRINAAGRLRRADAGLELALTEDAARATEIAEELDRVNAERRAVEQRMLFEAEAQAREQEGALALVVAAQGWHPGVAGIVASRLAERHHRPAVVIALDGERGTGSARSIPAFDLLGGLNACAAELARHGGHRAAAGLEIEAARVDAFRAALCAHAEAVLGDDDLVPVERVDAIVAGADLGHALAEELGALEPFGHGNPGVALLVPAARLADPRPMGEGGAHVRFSVEAGGARSRAVAFSCGGRLPVPAGTPADATFTLELDHWNGTVEPRLVLRHAQACAPEPVAVIGEPEDWLAEALAVAAGQAPGAGAQPTEAEPLGAGGAAARTAPLRAGSAPHPLRTAPADRRNRGVAGTVAALVATGEPVLVVCADAAVRAPGLRSRLGGFALVGWAALERDPGLAAPHAHVVAIDPPADPAALRHATVLAWGGAEVEFSRQIHERDHELRAPLAALYRSLRAAGAAEGGQLEALLRGDAARPRPARLAGRMLRVLHELGLVELDPAARALRVPPAPQRTQLERSETFRAGERRLKDGFRYLERATTKVELPAAAA